MSNNIDTTAAEIATICNAPATTSVEVTEWAYIHGLDEERSCLPTLSLSMSLRVH